jgi:hypothetical protein
MKMLDWTLQYISQVGVRIRAAFNDKLEPSAFSCKRLLPIGSRFFASGFRMQKNYISENVIKCCWRAFNGGIAFPNGGRYKMKFSRSKMYRANQ